MKEGDLRLNGETAASPRAVGKIGIHNVRTKVDMILGVTIIDPETAGIVMEGKALGTHAMMVINHAVGPTSAV